MRTTSIGPHFDKKWQRDQFEEKQSELERMVRLGKAPSFLVVNGSFEVVEKTPAPRFRTEKGHTIEPMEWTDKQHRCLKAWRNFYGYASVERFAGCARGASVDRMRSR